MPEKDHYCAVLIAAGPHETLVGDYKTSPMSKEDAVAAVSDLAKLNLTAEQLSYFGPDAKPVAATCYVRETKEFVVDSPWMGRLDWSAAPENGQPKE